MGELSGPRELNLVDPGEGTDLLFEVLAHPLSGEAQGAGAVLSVLRDVTDLRRAGHELERQMQRVRLAEFEATLDALAEGSEKLPVLSAEATSRAGTYRDHN